MKKFIFLFILFVCGTLSLSAQGKSEFQIGLATPSGDFADDDEDDAVFSGSGYAATGFYLGYKLLTPLSSKGLFWTFSAGVMYNDLSGDFKDDLEEEMEDYEDYYDDFDITYLKYINIPIMAGLQYEQPISAQIKLFGEAGLGINVLKLTNMSYNLDGTEGTYSFDPSLKLGYKIGGGILVKDKYTISLTYTGLGSHKVKYTYEEDSDSEDYKFDKALLISSLNVIFGIRF
jgi:hypothetical protein